MMWEILVPTVVPNTNGKKFFRTRYHRVWDSKVREITGGLTILAPAKGQWVSPNNILFTERMIPVRIMCDREKIERVVDMTMTYYNQEAILCYKVSDEVIYKVSPTIKNTS